MSYAIECEVQKGQLYRSHAGELHRVELVSRYTEDEITLVSYQKVTAPAFVHPEVWSSPINAFVEGHTLACDA